MEKTKTKNVENKIKVSFVIDRTKTGVEGLKDMAKLLESLAMPNSNFQDIIKDLNKLREFTIDSKTYTDDIKYRVESALNELVESNNENIIFACSDNTYEAVKDLLNSIAVFRDLKNEVTYKLRVKDKIVVKELFTSKVIDKVVSNAVNDFMYKMFEGVLPKEFIKESLEEYDNSEKNIINAYVIKDFKSENFNLLGIGMQTPTTIKVII